MMREPFLARPPPKSTGKELFNLTWLEERLAGREEADQDVQCTLAHFTALSIVRAVGPFFKSDFEVSCRV